MKVNYVISTYNGRANKRFGEFPSPGEILKYHLSSLLNFEHKFSQITIMKPESDNFYSDYYDIEFISKYFSIPVEIIECKNYGFSSGQFLEAYETYLDKFDYYLFVEDDYCPNVDNIDSFLISTYKNKFKDNKGVLCSVILGDGINDYPLLAPIHWDGISFTSVQTLQTLYSNPLFENDPKKWLDQMEILDQNGHFDIDYKWKKQKKTYLGAYYQLSFSQLFILSKIECKDYLDSEKLYTYPFWQDWSGDFTWYSKNLSKQGVAQDYNVSKLLLPTSPIIPIQLSTPKGILKYLNKKQIK